MKKKRMKTLVFLCVALVVLIGAYIAVTAYNADTGQETPTNVPEETTTILSLEGTVTELTVESSEGILEFIQKDEVWTEKNNEGFLMKQPPLNSMAGVFANLSATHVIEQNTENLSEYGLENPQYTITAKTADGKEAVLYVGMQNTITTEYYVYAKDVPGVYTVGTTSVNYFKRGLMDFAELPSYPTLEEEGFLNIETINKEEYLKAEMLESSEYDLSGILTWYVTAPFEHEYVAYTTRLDHLLEAVSGLSYNKAVAYKPGTAELEKMGLLKPEKEIAFSYKKTGKTEEDVEILDYHLYIGKEREEGDYYYVQEEGSDLVLLMNKAGVDEVMAYTAKDIVNQYFALINIDSVDTVEVVLDDSSKYEMAAPNSEDDDAKSEKLKDLYQSIISIHAEKVVDSQTENFKMLPLTITFHRNVEPRTYTVQFAEYDTSYYLAIVDGEGIYLVNKRDYEQYCIDVKQGFEGLGE